MYGDRSFVGDPCGSLRSLFSSRIVHKSVMSTSNGMLTAAGMSTSKARAEDCPRKHVFTRTINCTIGKGTKLRGRRGFSLLHSRRFFLGEVTSSVSSGGTRKSAIIAALSTRVRRITCGSLKGCRKTIVIVRPSAKGVVTVISGPSCSPGAMGGS